MKKRYIIMTILLILLCSLIGCNSNKSKNKEKEKEIFEGIKKEFFVDAESETKLEFIIPENIKDNCETKMKTNYDKGYCEVTVFLKNTNYNLFSVYFCEDETYENYENKKQYEVLYQKDGKTIIWYEYGYVDIDGKELPKEIKKIKSEYKRIKSSLSLEKK